MTTRICVTTIGAALFLGAASFSANAEEKSSAPILLAQSERGLERGKGHDKDKDKDKENHGKDVSDAAKGGARGDTSDVARSQSGTATGVGGAGTGTGGSGTA